MNEPWPLALRQWRIWTHLGWRDIRVRYALTVLGPLWPLFTIVLYTASLGVVYGAVFGVDLAEYLPYLASGLAAWSLISVTVTESSTNFTTNRGLLLNTTFPLPLYALAVVWRNLLLYGVALTVVIPIALWGSTMSVISLMQLVPALALVVCVLVALAHVLGIAGVLLPDLVALLPTLLFLVFLTSPILWSPEIVGERTWVYRLNPVYWMVQLLRAPFMGERIPLEGWLAVISCCVVVLIAAALVGLRFSKSTKLLL